MLRIKRLLVSVLLSVLTVTTVQAAPPATSIPYQGHLTDAQGIAFTAAIPIEVRLYDSAIAGIGQGVENSHVLYAERHPAVSVQSGNFHIAIGSGQVLDAKWTQLPKDVLASKENVYLELWIDGERLSPRQRMGSMPAAIVAERAKYADELEQKPTITADMMPAYDATLVTSGQFLGTQLPNLSADRISQGNLPDTTIPPLSAAKFKSGAGIPPLLIDRIPHGGISANTISIVPPPSDAFPANIVRKQNIAIGMGSKNNHEMITFPSGFTSAQCSVVYSFMSLPETVQDGLGGIISSLDGSNVVTCDYFKFDWGSDPNEVRHCAVSYFYVCKK